MSFSLIRMGKLSFFIMLAFFICITHVNSIEAASQTLIEKSSIRPLDWKGWFTIVFLILTITALILELRPPDITMLISTGILVIVGILPAKEFLLGFSNDIIMTIAMLCIIVRTIEIHGLLEVFGKKMLTVSDNPYKQIVSLMVPIASTSAFLNNTPIVLLMTPLVRRWSLLIKSSPSKFLIPLSYAAILGGMCTIIGTSTNLIIEGLVRTEGSLSISFFELGYIGVPASIIGVLYMTFFGRHLLPVRKDPLSATEEQARDFTAEFLVDEGCVLANKSVGQVGGSYFRNKLLLQIERDGINIDAPSTEFVIRPHDRLVFAVNINQIAELHAIEGLRSAADPHFKLDAASSHFSEIVISSTSLMIGKTIKQINFRSNYGASVFAVYREGNRVDGNPSEVVLRAGDTLMLLSSEEWHGGDFYAKDYYCIRNSEKLQVFHPKRAILVIGVLVAMITAATMGISIMIASMAAVGFFVFTRLITIREAQSSIFWNILLLIACSIAFGQAMVVTGVAEYVAYHGIGIIGKEPHHLIGGILLVAIISTELLSNNATALILFPIAIQIARLAGYDSAEAVKCIGVTIAIGCSCGFALPTGYQTHMIVYGEGGYKFIDFIKVGVPLDILIWIVGMVLIPVFWPLY